MRYKMLPTTIQEYIKRAVQKSIDENCPGYGSETKETVLDATLIYMEIHPIMLNVIEELVEENERLQEAAENMSERIDRGS